jgi:hypothetical protein
MILDDKSFDQLNHEDILALIPGQAENRRIDYKQALPDDGEKRVRSFLNDVCALANSAGGWLVYGVEEEQDDDGRKTGVPSSVCGLAEVNEDSAILDWQQRINQCIEPRIIGHRVGFVSGFEDDKKVMLVYVPRSLLSPHRVTFKGSRDFYIRHDRGNQLMDIGEIRAAFVDLKTLPERLNDYRAVRLSKVLADETPVPLVGSWTAAVHLIPLGSFGGEDAVDITSIALNGMPVMGTHTNHSRLNLDGRLFTCSYDDTRSEAYVQVFRDGVIEMVHCAPQMATNGVREPGNKVPLIASQRFEEGVIALVREALKLQASLGVKPPVYIGLSLLRTKGFSMARKSEMLQFRIGTQAIDRDIVTVPFAVSENMSEDAATLMRSAFDVVWQAAGVPQSDFYDAEGNRTGQ